MLRQILFEMRHQKMMTWVSISGTALAIFLIMVFFMAGNVRTVAVAPESNRDRILYGCNIHIHYDETDRDRAGALNHNLGEKLYANLEGVELMSYVTAYVMPVNVRVKGQDNHSLVKRDVDSNFWKIFDFTFLSGSPFDTATEKSGKDIAIITQSVARSLFNSDDVIGREILIGDNPYLVSGVVSDTSPMLKNSFAQVFTPLTSGLISWDNDMLGQLAVVLLLKEGASKNDINRQVEERYARVNSELAKDNVRIIYHQSPYDSELVAYGETDASYMTDPDLSSRKRDNAIIYTLLILLPAINLSCMTRSRMRHRISEIGVRRAFGAKRRMIVGQLLGENMIITLIGGGIGLLLSIIFMETLSSLFFRFAKIEFSSSFELLYSRPSISMLLTWDTFLIALGGCFILNLLSAAIPAWNASRIEPAAAIAKIR